MARHFFGGSPADIALERVSNALVIRGGATGTVWDAITGGNQLTDLTDPASNAITQVIADANGGVQFYGPDTVSRCWIDFGFGRYLMQANDLGQDVETLRSSVNTSISTLTNQVSGVVSQTIVDAKGDLLVGVGADMLARLSAGAPGQSLIADPLQASGLRWSQAWKRRALPHLSTADAVSSIAAPTYTTTKQATSTITSAQALLTPDTGPFTYLGAGSFIFGTGTPDSSYYLPTSRYPNTYASGQGNWAMEFWTDASVFEIKFKYVSTATMYRLSVDDRKMTDLAVSSGGTTAGSSHVLKVDFGSAAPRKIRFDFTTMPFGGLFLPPTATAWKSSPTGGRFGILGDSIVDGSANNAGAGIGTWTYRLARLLGITDVWDQSRGGTGYITPGTFATMGDRVALDIAPYSFDRLIVAAGYNDNGGSQTTIAAAATSLYAALKTAMPNGEIYVIGCHSPTGSPAASITNTDNTIKAAALAAGFPFVSPLSGSVYDGGGNLLATQGAWITAANASTYIGADNVHPNDVGHVYLSRRIYEAMKLMMAA